MEVKIYEHSYLLNVKNLRQYEKYNIQIKIILFLCIQMHIYASDNRAVYAEAVEQHRKVWMTAYEMQKNLLLNNKQCISYHIHSFNYDDVSIIIIHI